MNDGEFFDGSCCVALRSSSCFVCWWCCCLLLAVAVLAVLAVLCLCVRRRCGFVAVLSYLILCCLALPSFLPLCAAMLPFISQVIRCVLVGVQYDRLFCANRRVHPPPVLGRPEAQSCHFDSARLLVTSLDWLSKRAGPALRGSTAAPLSRCFRLGFAS